MDSPAAPEVGATAPDETDKADLPDISNFWPDAPHRVGPQPDHYEAEGAEATRTEPAWQPKVDDRPTVEISTGRPTIELHMVGRPPVKPRRPLGRTVAVVLAGVLAAGTAAWMAKGSPDTPVAVTNPPTPVIVEPDGNPPVSIETTPPAPQAPAAATFELADGVTELNVLITGTGSGAWFSATSPDGGAIRPRVEFDDSTVRVFADKISDDGPSRVDVLLSPEVAWSVRMRGGVRTGTFDLTGGRVDRIDLLGGAAAIDIALPEQGDAVVPVQMSGGVNDWRIRTADQVPVRATLRNGAGTVVLYGDRTQGVDRGRVLTATDGSGGLDVIADEGVGTLTVSAARAAGTIGG